jgi:hypothetical protein
MGWDEERTVVAQCSQCDKAIMATEVGTVEYVVFGPRERATLFRCNTCGHPLLYEENVDPFDDESTVWMVGSRLWPEPRRSLSREVPLVLRREFNQAQKCFMAQAYTATAVMVRRTLEGVCVENKISEKILARALRKMHDEGLIDSRLFEWAQALRVLGNEGAHFTGREVNKEDAADALALAEALLDYMYVLSAKFQEFQQRREGRKDVQAGDGAKAN